MTFETMMANLGTFLAQGDSDSQKFWNVITCLRGPDSPSERDNMDGLEATVAYRARRARKKATVEVIRGHALGGKVGGSAARWRDDIDYVTVPPHEQMDHFDRHVVKAANALGLKVRVVDSTPKDPAPAVEVVKKKKVISSPFTIPDLNWPQKYVPSNFCDNPSCLICFPEQKKVA